MTEPYCPSLRQTAASAFGSNSGAFGLTLGPITVEFFV